MKDAVAFANETCGALSGSDPSLLVVRCVETLSEFDRLSAAWEALAQSVPHCLFAQTAEWSQMSWRHFGGRPNDNLKIITAWHLDQLVAVWPFRQRCEGAVRRLDLLSCGICDVADPLVHPAFDTPDLNRRLFSELSRHGDTIELTCLAENSVMAKVVRDAKYPHFAVPFDDYTIDVGKWGSWDAFIGHFSQKMRHNLRRKRKNLQNIGAVSFGSVQDPAAQAVAIDWILKQKQAWFSRNFIQRDWFHARESRDFLVECLSLKNGIGGVEVFLLKRDDTIMSGVISLIDRRSVVGLIIAYDPAFHPFSPGTLLVEDMARWGYERGLVMELGIGKLDYKDRWATQVAKRVTFTTACNARGMVVIFPRYLAHLGTELRRRYVGPALKAILPKDKIVAVKSLLARLKPVPSSS
jgi:CelD/BcsL family acetyltransferase involved in cellulose biosynthesis